MSSETLSILASDNIRLLSVAMVEKAKSGHPGGAMGGADFIHILFSEFLRFDPDNPSWLGRDRFFLDPGHMSPMLYAQLALVSKFSLKELEVFRQWGSPTPGHPEQDLHRGIENTSGPLGLGHAFAAGAALAEQFLVARFGKIVEHKTYIYISDGGIQEEIAQGVGRISGHLGLGNIIMFFDSNKIQLSTTTHRVSSEDTKKKYEAWGWEVIKIDGNNHEQIRTALSQANNELRKPSLIIGKTIMGKGTVDENGNKYEGKVELHGKPIGATKASYEKTIEHLGGNIHHPFTIFPEVKEYYLKVLEKKRATVKSWKKNYDTWSKSNSNLSKTLTAFLEKKFSKLDWQKVQLKANGATREASGSVLSYLADNVPNMIVASADLSNSDKTDGFLKKTKPFTRGDFSGGFLHAGVSELTMASISVGMALHGGVVPVCGTFFVFSDYMKPAVRLAALMKQHVIFLWTHDSFRVGEDGPTHQPIEHEAQIRLLEQLNNHSHQSSFIALRPADSKETLGAWKIALEHTHTPVGLILSRQGINDIKTSMTVHEIAKHQLKGAYVVYKTNEKVDIILIANGSEVSTLIETANILKEKYNCHSQVVSIPSLGLFEKQDKSYKNKIIPQTIPHFALSSGLSSLFYNIVGKNSIIQGVNHFGYSAPYKVLDEKFGFTPDAISEKIKTFLTL